MNNHIVSQIIGVLVNEDLSAKEAINIVEEAKDTFLSRSFHINAKEEAD